MSKQNGQWQDVREWAVDAAADAARLAVRRLNEGMDIQFKADGSTVTDIDRAVEEFLRERIARSFPDHAILGEEMGAPDTLDADTPLWAIDPIDGTANLAAGLHEWGVSIGLVAGGVPVVGALNFPLIEETFAGSRGGGGTRNGKPLPQLDAGGALHGEDLFGTCSSSIRNVDLSRAGGKFRIFGSAALHLCYVAGGQLKGAMNVGTSLYDVAAALCVAHETGAAVGWLSGEEWDALDMARAPRPTDPLLCAPPETLAVLRRTLRL